jgi:hypothetical protein
MGDEMDLDEHEDCAAAQPTPAWVLLGDSGMMLRMAARPPADTSRVPRLDPRAAPADRDDGKR